MSKSSWSLSEQKLLEDAIEDVTTNNKWNHADKYNRINVPVWRLIKARMGSSRPYNLIRQRYKKCHDVEITSNNHRILTQLEERTLSKFVQRSPGGSVKYKKGFDVAATQMKLPVSTARKRCGNVCWLIETYFLLKYLMYECHHRLFAASSKISTRRCSFVGCDINGNNKTPNVSLISLPKDDRRRSLWWLKMGHPRSSLPPPKNARCCTRHIDTRLPRKFWMSVAEIANVFDNTNRRIVRRDRAAVQRRRERCAEELRAQQRSKRVKNVITQIGTSPLEMANKFVDLETKAGSEELRIQELEKKIESLELKLEGMAPSKLSTLTDAWVKSFTPFRSKVCLCAFLMEMVLPNLQHAWFVEASVISRMHACMYICMYVMYDRMHVHMHVYMHVMYDRMHACMHVYMHVMYDRMYACMYAYACDV